VIFVLFSFDDDGPSESEANKYPSVVLVHVVFV